jgi:hypothetical protein
MKFEYFNNLYDRIHNNLISNKYKIVIKNKDYYTILELFLEKELVGTIYGAVTDDVSVTPIHSTRNVKSIEQCAININWICIEKNFRSKGLSYILLLLFILLMYKKYNNIEYIVLDDCSDKSQLVKGNLYSKFGFISSDIIIPNTNLQFFSYPEKQTTYSYLYENRNSLEKNILNVSI